MDSNLVRDGHQNNKQPLTIPLKATNRKTTFCRKLGRMNSKTDVMMDDILDDIELDAISWRLSDDNSDDTMRQKPHHHNYSTMTIGKGLQIEDNLSGLTQATCATNDSMV